MPEFKFKDYEVTISVCRDDEQVKSYTLTKVAEQTAKILFEDSDEKQKDSEWLKLGHLIRHCIHHFDSQFDDNNVLKFKKENKCPIQ